MGKGKENAIAENKSNENKICEEISRQKEELKGKNLKPEITGACVYKAGSEVYCARLTEKQCSFLEGTWFEGENCPRWPPGHNVKGVVLVQVWSACDQSWINTNDYPVIAKKWWRVGNEEHVDNEIFEAHKNRRITAGPSCFSMDIIDVIKTH